MRSSGSRSDFDDLCNFGSMQNSGVDLRNYKDQLQKDRNSRTLTLRSMKRPSISGVRNSNFQVGSCSRNLSLLDVNPLPFLNPEHVAEVFASQDESTIKTLINQIADTFEESPKLISKLAKNTEIFQPIIDCLNGEISESLVVSILQFITIIFPQCTIQGMNAFVDCDLCFSLYAFITSDNPTIIAAAIQVVAVISEQSSYARDAIISFGLHTSLMEQAQAGDEQLSIACCDALNKIFANPDPIDSATIIESVTPMAQLFSLTSIPALQSVIECFVEITSKMPSIIFTLYDLDLYPTIIGFLSQQELLASTLSLIGNMSVAHPPQIRCMLQLGIFDTLLGLIGTDYATYVFWIFSNMLESVPQDMLPYFTDDLVSNAISSVLDASFDVKKEATYFLSTLIVFSDPETVPHFMTQEITDMVVEMLGCGVTMIVLRCIDTLICFVHVMKTNPECAEFQAILMNTDIIDRLNDTINPDSPFVSERAEYLLQQIQGFEESS